MGRTTRNFRQSKKSMSGDAGAKNYARIARSEGWHIKLINYIKVRGKRNNEQN